MVWSFSSGYWQLVVSDKASFMSSKGRNKKTSKFIAIVLFLNFLLQNNQANHLRYSIYMFLKNIAKLMTRYDAQPRMQNCLITF